MINAVLKTSLAITALLQNRYNMTLFLSMILFIFFSISSYSQSSATYRADLSRLQAILKKTPSFRDQVRGDQLKAYDHLYDSLAHDTMSISSDYMAFNNLIQLFFPFKDNHLGFYQVRGFIPGRPGFGDSATMRQYRASQSFQQYPRYCSNIDSLEVALREKPKDSVEGIYYYENYLKVGLFRTSQQTQFIGIVLSTTMPQWDRGQVAIRLYEYMPHFFRAVYAHPVSKGLMLYCNEKFRNQSLVNSYFYSSVSGSAYKKDPGEIDFVNIARDEPKFQFRRIGPATLYLRLGNFSAMTDAMRTSQSFYEQIRDSLTSDELMLDLRNNDGGAQKVSRKFLALLKRFTKKGGVLHVLINNGTMSQGEIFTLQLKKLPNVSTYGEPTMGTIAYGSNYGKRERLPSGKFEIYITDMKDKDNYLPYENRGVTPDTALRTDAPWIDQVLKETEKK